MKAVFRTLIAAALITTLQAQAAPVFENAATAVGESSVVTVSKPDGTQADDLLVAALMLDRGKRIDVTTPSGWTLIRRSNSHRYVGMATYYHVAGSSEPANYSFPLDEKTKWAASISRISGADPENPRDNSARATGKKGNVVAASVTTRKDDTLVLAYYTNRRNATYTPDPSTTERYDEPNAAGGLPSNMLATFEQAKAGASGNKTAVPSRSDRHWVAMQIAIAAGEAAPADLSGFSIAATGSPTAGDSMTLQIVDAQDVEGAPLNETVAAAIASNLDGLVFDADVVFIDGQAILPVTLTTVGSHVLTAGLAGIPAAQNLTLTVRRRPITLTADPQSKPRNDPDPELTFALTDGRLLDGFALSGQPARDPGEDAGVYKINQGTLTDANNSAYAITFVSANFEIIAPPPPPPPATATGIWISAAELAELPMSGEPWQNLKNDADLYWGAPNISDQEDKANIYAMSKALVYARTGIESYRTEVIEACMQAIGTEEGGRSLALGRNLGAFVIAADLVGLPPEEEVVFRAWLRTLLTERMSDGRSLTSCHEDRPNNWGTHAGGSRAAVAAYLGDDEELDRIAQVFKGWLGNRNSYSGFKYGDLYWQADPANPVAINPKGATLQGHNVDGVLPDDQRRGGSFSWPPPQENYVYEALQGALLEAVILHRAGYDVWNWEDKALLRAFTWLHNVADFPAEGDDLWQPFIINYFYGTDFPVPSTSRYGKNVARTCWTHQ